MYKYTPSLKMVNLFIKKLYAKQISFYMYIFIIAAIYGIFRLTIWLSIEKSCLIGLIVIPTMVLKIIPEILSWNQDVFSPERIIKFLDKHIHTTFTYQETNERELLEGIYFSISRHEFPEIRSSNDDETLIKTHIIKHYIHKLSIEFIVDYVFLSDFLGSHKKKNEEYNEKVTSISSYICDTLLHKFLDDELKPRIIAWYKFHHIDLKWYLENPKEMESSRIPKGQITTLLDKLY